jgi:hypothetical protein
LSKYPNLAPRATQGLETIEVKVIFAFFSISYLFFGSNVVLMGYAEPQGELPPQLQQQLQQQGLTSNATASPSPQLQPQPQQAPPITFQQEEEPCDGAYFVGPGGTTKCM